jgi:hypothetical protein
MSHDNGLTEHAIQSQILDYLKAKRIFHWRNNSGAMKSSYRGKSRFMHFGAVGSPDIFVVVKGKIVGFEVKGQGKYPSEAQVHFGDSLTKAGGFYYVVRSLDEVTNILGRF